MQAPQRTVRLAADADNEYEVMQHDGDDEDEAMFEFDDEEEAQEYERGQAALAKELAAKAAAENGGASPAASASAASVPVTVDGTAAAAAAAAAAPGVGGIATVVKVAMTATGGDAPGEEVRVLVGLDVFDRYVPHLNANKAESLPESGNITSEDLVSPTAAAASNGISSSSSNNAAAAPAAASSSGVARMTEEDDSDAESADADADASGADLVLTGDLELDQRTLAGLMAGKDAPMAAVEEESSSDDEDDEEDLQLRAAAAKLEDIGSDEEADTGTRGVYTKNELKPDQIAAPAEFTVGAADELVAVGRISSVVDRMMVVESGLCLSSSGRKALDIGSAICLADRTPVGRVEEVMGLVSEPYYAVRLLASTDASRLPNPDASDDEEEGSSSLAGEEATMVYSIPTLSSFASVDSRPPTDASNMHDEEVAEDEQEFSDDEKEQEAKAARKNARKKNAMEKRKDAAAAAAADGTASAAAAGVLPTGRPIIKAKRNNRLSGGDQPAPTGATSCPAGAASSAAVPVAVPAFNPAPAVGGGLLSSPFVPAPVSAPAANAPLLPMPGSVPQQPFNPYGQGAAQPFVFSPGAATPQQQQQQQQHAHAHAQQQGQHAYGYYPQQQQQQHAYGAPYAQQAHPYAAYYAQQQQQQQQQYGQYPQQQQSYGQYAPQPVAGGFAGWGAQNLAGGYAQQQHMYAQQPYGAAYPPNPYAQQQPQAPQQPQQAAGVAPVAQPGSAPPQ